MRVRTHQGTFATGEISPELDGVRPDLERYPNALRTAFNVIITETGAAVARPGSRHVAAIADEAKPGRLSPFVFSRAQAYTIEFGDTIARIFKEDGIVLSLGVPYTITGLPYTTADLPTLRWVQSRDQLYLFHASYQTRILTRLDHDDWTVELFAPDNGPFLDENLDVAQTIQASAVSGSGITLTATGFTFDAGHAGALYKIASEDLSDVEKWVGNVDYVDGKKIRANGNVYENVSGATRNSGPNIPSHDAGDEKAGSDGTTDYVTWRYLHSGFGIVRITAVAVGGATATADVLSRLPDDVVSAATAAWNEGAWSDYRGWPAIGGFHEQRLTTAGAPGDPLALHFSQSADFANFDLADGAGADAISFTLPTVQGDGISWLRSSTALFIGTIAQEHVVRASRNGEALTATNINRSAVTDEGSANIEPVQIADAILFVAGDRSRLIEMGFDPNANSELGFQATDIDRFSRHIARRGIREIVWHRNPWRVAWLRLADGGLGAISYRRKEGLIAWTDCAMAGGFVESLAVSPTTDSGADELWMIVRRTIMGSTRRYVERLAPAFDYDLETTAANAFQVDSGLPFDLGSPSATLTGLAHLEGETVTGVGDGLPLTPAVVSGGQVTFDRAVSAGCVGLAFEVVIEPVSPETNLRDGPSVGRRRSFDEVIVHVVKSAGAYVEAMQGIEDEYGLTEADAPDEGEPLMATGTADGSPLPLHSGPVAGLAVGGGNGRRQSLRIRQPSPLPLKVTGITLTVDYSEDS